MKNKLVTLLVLTSIICLLLSIYFFYTGSKDEVQLNNKMNDVEKAVEIIDGKDEEQKEESSSNDRGKTSQATIDWKYLHSLSDDIIAWIYVPGTTISYPVLQGDNNQQYVRHLYDGTYNIFGSIFADYRNNFLEDDNTLIFGHNTFNNTMFGGLNNFSNKNFFNNHPYIYIYMEDKTYQFTIFTTYVTKNLNGLYIINTDSKQEYLNHLNNPKNKVNYIHRDISIDDKDKLLTLSTCSFINEIENPDERLLVHAVLTSVEDSQK